MSSIAFKGDKLVGKTNYIEWLTQAKLFLEINGFMPYVDNSLIRPNKDLYYDGEKAISAELAVRYYEREADFIRNDKRALGAIKSIISLDNTERFKDKTSASTLWEAINSTYGDSSFELLGRYFEKLINNSYNSYKNIDEYTSTIQSASIYLRELKCEVPKPLLVWLLLKGLPSSFDSFASRKYEELSKKIDNYNTTTSNEKTSNSYNNYNNIDILNRISELVSEEGRIHNTSNALELNKATIDN
jgi:hypothetical protein